jgi:CubicO group peptidase (beta-lactamase class C family)
LPSAKPEEVGVSSVKVEELSKFMQSLVDQGKIAGGVTMMARHGKVIHLKAVGMADREAEKPMQIDAIFRIASMTKPVTSVAVMMLYEQGKLGLDDPVWKYMPEFKNPKVLVSVNPLRTEPAKREITIRHLLTHTSGLGYPSTPHLGALYEQHGIPCGCVSAPVTLEENMRKLAGVPLLFHPGEKWEYGMSTDVLGRVIEVVSAVTLDRFFETEIFTRLGMKDTFFKVPREKVPRLVAAYIPLEAGIRKLKDGEIVKHGADPISADYPYLESHRYLSGGGDLCSTVTDYMRFCQMLLNRGQLDSVRLLREETIGMMTTNQLGTLPNRFGFGFGIMPETDDIHRQLRGSYNWGGYWSTSFRISPRGDWILITTSQVAWDDKATSAWFTQYEKIATEAVEK